MSDEHAQVLGLLDIIAAPYGRKNKLRHNMPDLLLNPPDGIEQIYGKRKLKEEQKEAS
jgi:hypothetical protein